MNGLCHDVRAGEATGDPGLEVVVAGGDCRLYLLDSRGRLLRQTEVRDHPRGSDHGATQLFEPLTAAILNTEGTPRIFAATSRFDVLTFDVALSRLERAVYSAQHGGVDLWALDVSGDGKKEVFCTDHYGHLHVVAHNGEKIRAYYTSIGDMTADFGDLDGDGLTEAVFGSSTGNVMGLTFAHADPWKGEYQDPWWWQNVGYPVNRIRVADVDDDGKDEVLIAAGTGYVYVLEGGGMEKWRYRAQTNVTDVISVAGKRSRVVCLDSSGSVTCLDGLGTPTQVRWLETEPRYVVECEGSLIVATVDGVVALPAGN